MAKRTSRQRKKKSSRTTGGIRARLAKLGAIRSSRGRPWLAGTMWLLCVGGLIVGWILGVPRLTSTVAAAAQPEAISIEFTSVPKDLDPQLLQSMKMTAARQLSRDVFRQLDLVLVRRALMESGWFESVRQVHRVRADLIRIDATFARHFAVLRDREGDHLVDPDGRLLPPSYKIGDAHGFIVIDGAFFNRPDALGARWEGADVAAGLQLLKLLEAEPWLHQVAVIDVADYLEKQQMTLVTDRGSRIIWAAAPGEERAGEATAEQKLFYLRYQHEHFGHIDGGHGGELDISSPSGVFVIP